MRRTIAVPLLILLSVGLRLTAQTSGAMRPTVPSPTAASLGKFGDVPVSFFTGVPEIRIPLFTAKGKTLELPIALTYHASGIKVDEVGGWVGMGWALEAGGVITRTVRDIVDEKPEGYLTQGRAFYNANNWTEPPPTSLLYNIADQVVDGEPDQFFFNFAGQSGEMVFGPTSNIASETTFVTIPYRKWRIVPHYGTDPYFGYGSILSWVITTEDGTRYTFAAIEVHQDWWWQYLGSSSKDLQPYGSSWYLTEIRAPGGDVITFQYAPYSAEHYKGLYREEFNDKGGTCPTPGYASGPSTIYDVHTQSYVKEQKLVSITTAAHTITFWTSLRTDAIAPYRSRYVTSQQAQEHELDSIIVKTPDNVVVRRFAFRYNYSIGNRLTLTKLYEVGKTGDSVPPYTFTYSGPTLPARATDVDQMYNGIATFALDHWGYYNGRTGNTTLIPQGVSLLPPYTNYPGADRRPDATSMKAGVLTKITYPTGGFNEFVYEPNDYGEIADGSPLISDPVSHSASAVIPPGSGVTDFTVGGVDPTVSATISVVLGYPPNPCPSGCSAELWQGTNRLNTWFSAVTNVPYQLAPGLYTLKVFNQGQNYTVSLSVNWQERVVVPKKTAGGLRIVEVHAADAMGSDGVGNLTVRKYSYLQNDAVTSTGVIGSEPRYGYAHTEVDRNGLQCAYFSRSSTSRIPLGSGPAIEYLLVKESRGASGEFGTTRHSFVAGGDVPQPTDWPLLRYTSNAWRRGQEVTVEQDNAAGAVQRYTFTRYDFPTPAQTTKTFRGIAVNTYSGAISVVVHNRFLVETGLKVPGFESTTVYDTAGGGRFTTTKQFVYGNPNHAQLTEETDSIPDGTRRVTHMKYPADYAPCTTSCSAEAAALTAMQDTFNIHSAVIERWVIKRGGGVDSVMTAELNSFKQYAPGQFLPYQHFVLSNPSPLP